MAKQPSKDALRVALRSKGYKATRPRVRILEVLERARKPLSIRAIVRALSSSGVDRVTVYRTLKSLKESGVVRQVDLEHAHAHYELASAVDHHHLVCVKCDTVEDFIGCNVEPLAKAALSKSKQFAKVLRHSFELFCVCKSCAKK